AELWAAAKVAMIHANAPVATALAMDIEAHSAIFLSEWKYSAVTTLAKPALDAAWAMMKDPTVMKTRLATFR
ncbi:MAG: hypothetical protein IT190_08000, partial [Microbacteriaceae bacterium]|nr:hypothetical protein [Microbacteriaceae bacterium]